MFKREKTREVEILEIAIENAFSELQGLSVETEEHAAATDELTKLMKFKEELTSKNRVSAETLAMIGGNLAGILLILNFERAGVVASKALGFVSKLR